jgi:hypothetical protein
MIHTFANTIGGHEEKKYPLKKIEKYYNLVLMYPDFLTISLEDFSPLELHVTRRKWRIALVNN